MVKVKPQLTFPLKEVSQYSVVETHPHLAQIPVVVVRLILVSQLSAQDNAILPTLRT